MEDLISRKERYSHLGKLRMNNQIALLKMSSNI
jgi:hypothetical protein